MKTHAETPLPERVSLAIIGGGPTGLACAWHARQKNIDCVVLEKESPGASVARFPLLMEFFSDAANLELPGMTLAVANQGKPTREQYLAALLSYIRQYDLPVYPWKNVTALGHDPKRDEYELTVHPGAWPADGLQPGGSPAPGRLESFRPEGGRVLRAARVVFAGGQFLRPRVPAQIQSPRLVHGYPEAHHFFGQRVAILGGGNSSVDFALKLRRIEAAVHLIIRTGELPEDRIKKWLWPELSARIEREDIYLHRSTSIASARDRTDGAVELSLENGTSGRSKLTVDFIVPFIGWEPDWEILTRMGLESTISETAGKLNFHVDPTTGEHRDFPGLFIAGTAASRDNFIEHSRLQADRLTDRVAAGLSGK